MLMLIACGAGVYLGLHFNVLGLLPLSLLWAGAFIFSSMVIGAKSLRQCGRPVGSLNFNSSRFYARSDRARDLRTASATEYRSIQAHLARSTLQS